MFVEIQGEPTEGISAVGVAFRTRTGLIYAISIPVPSQRFAKDALAEDLLDALESIGAVLEGNGSGRQGPQRKSGPDGPGGRSR